MRCVVTINDFKPILRRFWRFLTFFWVGSHYKNLNGALACADWWAKRTEEEENRLLSPKKTKKKSTLDRKARTAHFRHFVWGTKKDPKKDLISSETGNLIIVRNWSYLTSWVALTEPRAPAWEAEMLTITPFCSLLVMHPWHWDPTNILGLWFELAKIAYLNIWSWPPSP